MTNRAPRQIVYDDATSEHIASRVRQIMGERGLTQSELADLTRRDDGTPELRQGAISKILKRPGETTHVRFTGQTLAAIARALGLAPRDLLPPTAQAPESTGDLEQMSDQEDSLPPLIKSYFDQRRLLDDEKEFLREVGTLRHRGQPLTFEMLDDIVAALRRANPRPAPSGGVR